MRPTQRRSLKQRPGRRCGSWFQRLNPRRPAPCFLTRDLFVRQRTQTINALRAHLAEHGVIAPQGIANLALLAKTIEDHEAGLELIVVETGRLYLDEIEALSSRIASLVT